MGDGSSGRQLHPRGQEGDMVRERDGGTEDHIHEEPLPLRDQENGNVPFPQISASLAQNIFFSRGLTSRVLGHGVQVIREEQLVWYEEQKINKRQRYASYSSCNQNLDSIGTAFRKASMRADPSNPGAVLHGFFGVESCCCVCVLSLSLCACACMCVVLVRCRHVCMLSRERQGTGVLLSLSAVLEPFMHGGGNA